MESLLNADATAPMRYSAGRANGALQAMIAKDQPLADLMRRVQCGSEGAYSRLLAELLPVVRRMIRRQMAFASPSDQEDVLQEVLMSIHAARASYNPNRPFTPWLKAIVVNRSIDFMRRHRRNAAVPLLTEELAADIADAAAGDAMTRYDAVDALKKAIDRLPSGQRTAIELLKLREMSLREAAAVTGMSVSALKALVHRAVGTLRVSLAPQQMA